MALVSFRLFSKNLGNLEEFFGQMDYRPPLAKNCPYAYGKGSSFHCLLKSSINDTTSFIRLDKRKFFSIYQRNLTDYYAAVDPSNMILIFAR